MNINKGGTGVDFLPPLKKMIEDKTNENIIVPMGGVAANMVGGQTIKMTSQNDKNKYFEALHSAFSPFSTLETIRPSGSGLTARLINKKLKEEEKRLENEKKLEEAMKWSEEQQKKEWEREDQIRQETQEREDTAVQRWVEDVRKAGINPNLFSGTGAASGGGITSATGLNTTKYEKEAERLLNEWETMVEQEFKRDENKKDRFNNILKSLINLAGLGIMASTRK